MIRGSLNLSRGLFATKSGIIFCFCFFIFVATSFVVDVAVVSGELSEPLEITLTGARLRAKSPASLSPGGKLGPAVNPPAAGSTAATAEAGQIPKPHVPKPSPRAEMSHTHHTTMLKMSAAYVEAPQYKSSASSYREDGISKRKPNRRPSPNQTKNNKLRPELRARRLNPAEVGKLVIAFKDMADRINSYQRRAAATARVRQSNTSSTRLASSSTTKETARNHLLQLVRKSSIHNRGYQRQLFTNGMTVQDVLPLLISILETKGTTLEPQNQQTTQEELAWGAPFEPDVGDAYATEVNITLSEGIANNLTADSKTKIVITQDASESSSGKVKRPFKFSSTTMRPSTTTMTALFSDPPVIVTFADNSPSIFVTGSELFQQSSLPAASGSSLRPSSLLSPVMGWGNSMLDHSFFRTVGMEMLHSMMEYEFQQ